MQGHLGLGVDGVALVRTPIPVFDRVSWLRQSLNDEALAREVLGLFLQQLSRLSQSEWQKLDLAYEMHTLKGSAGAVGACEIAYIADYWREYGPSLPTHLMQAIVAFKKEATLQ